ncbi:TetR/AcrR family transcriptional regulator [Brevibacillus borstelensis]|uniref:TetR/AcrR family transcriptional regulator n=1 Tax=Brevibacillus borstelensis TaxID=45462 RepID=UPI0030BC5D28
MDAQERSRTAKGEASRQRLLAAATAQFARKGYPHTRVSDIVKAAGLTQAAFYLYFPSKEAIFAELVDSFRRKLGTLAQAAGKVTSLAPGEAAAQIKENLRAVFAFLQSQPELTRIAWFESPDAKEMKEKVIALLSAHILSNQQAGHIRKELVPEVAAYCIIGMIDQLAERWIVTGEKQPEQLTEEMSELLLHGVLASSPSR